MFSYCDNPVKIFQDEETEAYQELICPRLRMGNGSGQGMNRTGAPCERTVLAGEVFYNRGQARPNSHFAASGVDWSALLGVQAADLVFSISSHVAVLCAWSM